MKKWLKRIRGALGLGLTWAVAWAGGGAILGLMFGGGLGTLITGSLAFGLMGFLSGGAFSVVLGLAGGRRTFDQMSLRRFAAWGAVGGLPAGVLLSGLLAPGAGATLAGVLFAMTPLLVASMLVGAASAAGSLALARKADRRDLLEAGGSAGLIEGA